MAVTRTAQHGPRTDSGTSAAGALRSAAVAFGPSVVLNGLLAASTVAAARDIARARFRRLLWPPAALGAIAAWVYLLVVRPWVLHWGASSAEVNEALPGDEFVPQPVWQSTRAIDIAAPIETVWPWLAQMGQDKGGLYSYDWLEDLAGLDFHSADRIVPEWQDVHVGDVVRFAPDQDTLVVVQAEPERCLVWRILNPETHQPGDVTSGAVSFDATWAFVLRATDAGHTRLIQRFRFGSWPRTLGLLYTAFIEIPHFVMERRMLLGIRERAEAARAGQ